MDFQDVIAKAQDAMTVNRVYGKPIERDGVVIIPAAEVGGGGGGGGGSDQSGSSGNGGGYGLRARPAGAYVIREGNVKWEPAVDISSLLTRVGLIAIGLAVALRVFSR